MMAQRRVAFSETDASGRVHFTSILKWAEDAEHEFLRAKGLPVLTKNGGWPRVNVSCDYQRPLAFGEVVSVEIELEKIGRSSLTWSFEVLTQDGESAAKGQMTTVWIENDQKAEIDAETRALLQGGQ